MPRVTRGNRKLIRRKKILKMAKGYFGARRKNYRTAKEAVERALSDETLSVKGPKSDVSKIVENALKQLS